MGCFFGVTVLVAAVIGVHFKEMFLMFFDEEAAAVSGLPIKFYNIAITMLTALVISVSIKIVGALLVSSLLTIPVACSLILSKSFKHSVFLAILFSEISVVLGLVAAGIWNLAPGATIVLFLIALLIGVLIVKRRIRV